MMTEKIQLHERHPSYQKHRRQFWLQIILPMIVAVLIVIAVAVVTGAATFGGGGDSPRWAAISTIWLVIPVMFFGLLFLGILAGLVYLLARLLEIIPPYTAVAQHYTFRAVGIAKEISDGAAKPVILLQGIFASIKAFLGRY